MALLSPTAIDAFFSDAEDAPVVMLNLIHFAADGGRDRYLKYLNLAEPILQRFGARILYSGNGLAVLSAGDTAGWDAVVLVQYPSRSAFQNMIADPDYQVAFKVGVSAIKDIVLQPLEPLAR